MRTMPTIKDVALAAGCSTATVSRALANPEKVTEATRKRVASAIAKVGYSPNLAARNLRRSESRTIVVLLPDIANPFFSEIIAGLEDVAHREGYRVLLGDCEHDTGRAKAYFDLLPTNQADGIILLTAEIPLSLVTQQARGSQIPLVMACEYFDHLALPTVRICIDRVKGYQSEMARQQLAVNPGWIVEGDFGFLSGYQQGQLLLALPPEARPSAIFCHSDEMAIGLMKAARDASVRVPEDLSVIGFDNIGLSEYCQPELTTVSQPRDEIGRCAMRLLLDVLRKKQVPHQQVLSTQLIVRASTAQAPKP